MSAENAAGGCSTSKARMVGPGTVASMWIIAETSCRLARLAALACPGMMTGQPISHAGVALRFRLARSAGMVGWSNAPGDMAHSKAVSASPLAPEKLTFRPLRTKSEDEGKVRPDRSNDGGRMKHSHADTSL